jgi:protein involved in polysaccharide export with SLBB domain
MTRTAKCLLACLSFFSAASLRGQTAPVQQQLNPGDQIRIVVWKDPTLSGDFTIAGNGTIIHPLYREVQVTGVALSEVEERIRTFLKIYTTNPQFVIQPLVKVIVGGEVRSPNVLSVPPETTVAQAVALAGGPTDRGALDHVRLLREGQEIIVDLSKADSQAASLQIRSGDQILVTRTSNFLRDYFGPTASAVAAVAAIVNIVRR